MLIFTEASSTHSKPAAIQSVEEFGIATNAAEARTAPVRKYGRLRPSLHQVRSLMYPIIGWSTKPVTGAASQSSGSWDSFAPSIW